MEKVTGLSELAARFAEAEQKRSVSDDAFRASLTSWYFDDPFLDDRPADPLTPAYKSFQLDFYTYLTDKAYQTANEETEFDFEHELAHPYPYNTQSFETVGGHLLGYGWLIKNMRLSPGAKILEIGSGYGSLTEHLAQMGYRVTCLDISASLLKFVQARTADVPQPVQVLCGDMAEVEIHERYDAVIFNASLHHSLAHRQMIDRLADIVTPNGIVAFAAEPIFEREDNILPYPWGIRLDGLSLWAVCQWGWMELGFQKSYFQQTLQAAGWHLKRANLGISGLTDIWIASQEEREVSAVPQPVEQPLGSTVSLEQEVVRLRRLVADYEKGRFIRFMRWINERFGR